MRKILFGVLALVIVVLIGAAGAAVRFRLDRAISSATESIAHQLCTAASAAGHGGEDLAAVITTLEYLAGMRG